MSKDLITVIVPIYNVEPYLRKCVDSILTQTYTNLEIILIDDGSPDNCGAICDEYAKKDKRVKVIHKANGGVSSARNAGLDIAKGEYIAFVDADDYIPRDYFKALRKDMTDDVDIVRCKAETFLPNGEKDTGCQIENPISAMIVLDAIDFQNFTKYSNWEVWAALYRRSVIGGLRFNTTIHYGEDILFYYSVVKRCNKIKYTISATYCYVCSSGSAMRSPFSEKQYTEVYAWQDACRLYADSAEISKILKERYIKKCHEYLNKIRYYGIHNADEKIKFLKHEMRQLLWQGLKGKKFRSKIKFILNAYLPEKMYAFIKKLYK